MNPVVLQLLTWALSSRALRQLIIGMLAAMVARTDNSVDDMFVDAAARALDIRIPDYDIGTVPPDNNIFLGQDELAEIKAALKPAVINNPPKPRNSTAFTKKKKR